jgi:hypothetical protein
MQGVLTRFLKFLEFAARTKLRSDREFEEFEGKTRLKSPRRKQFHKGGASYLARSIEDSNEMVEILRGRTISWNVRSNGPMEKLRLSVCQHS